MRRLLRRLLGRGRDEAESGVPYWEQRARQYGARSVLNIRHTAEEMAAVTEWQKGILFPHLQRQLSGGEQLLLDFGCGPGRFTPALAEMVGCRAVGVDPIQSLLDLAPAHPDVEYRRIDDGRIPLEDSAADIAWICLVLGTITDDDALRASVAEIGRVLRPGGLVFLVENTAEKQSIPRFSFRSVDAYRSLFPGARLEHVDDYYDVEERISILAGPWPA